MAEKQGGISASFYLQLGIIVSIVCSSIVGFTYLGSLIEDKIDEKVAPLIAKIEALEDRIDEHDQLLAVNTDRVSATMTSMNIFIEYYNKVYHKEFLRPMDITERSIATIQPKKRRR